MIAVENSAARMIRIINKERAAKLRRLAMLQSAANGWSRLPTKSTKK